VYFHIWSIAKFGYITKLAKQYFKSLIQYSLLISHPQHGKEDLVISHTYTIGDFGTNYIIFRNAENFKNLLFSKKIVKEIVEYFGTF
jgi:hypothetical protein